MTDIGARALALYIGSYGVDNNIRPEELSRVAKNTLLTLTSNFPRLPSECMDATLLTLKASLRGSGIGQLEACAYGDGVITLGMKSGEIRVVELIYENSYPYYVVYEFDKSRLAYVPDGWELCVYDYLISESGQVSGETISFMEPGSYYVDLSEGNYDWAAVASDGLASFLRSGGRVPVHEVVAKLFKFKSMTGEFLQRRFQGFEREYRELGWNHYDDLSIAAVIL
jgi:hypothetical protein